MFQFQRYEGGEDGGAVVSSSATGTTHALADGGDAGAQLIEQLNARAREREEKARDAREQAVKDEAELKRLLHGGDGTAAHDGDDDEADAQKQAKRAKRKGHRKRPRVKSAEAREREVEVQLQREAMGVPRFVRQGQAVHDGNTVDVDASALAPVLRTNLHAMGIDSLFPVQTTVIPHVLRAGRGQGGVGGDVCVCAPTGSGKTLAFALPVVHMLLPRVVTRLRALVLVPTRDLALQVFGVFRAVTANTPLRVAVVTGQQSFRMEQRALVGDAALAADARAPAGGTSVVDIVVATPGRLRDHLKGTPGFTLQHLRYLVVDEMDRMLKQTYSGWLDAVLEAVHAPRAAHVAGGAGVAVEPVSRAGGGGGGAPLCKMFFSATLTRESDKIESLQLRNPCYFSASRGKRYRTPATLKEHFVRAPLGQKPLLLLALLQTELRGQSVVVFSASVESTHRLFRLIELHGGFAVAEYSSNLSQAQRTHMLSEYRAGRIRVIVCSDALSRGLDVDHAENVVNFDVPAAAKLYVHRVGRTARAGRSGHAWTMLEPREISPFKNMLRQVDNNYCAPHWISRDVIDAMVPRYEAALAELKMLVRRERQGQVSSQHLLLSGGRGDLIDEDEAEAEEGVEAGVEEEGSGVGDGDADGGGDEGKGVRVSAAVKRARLRRSLRDQALLQWTAA